MTDAEIVAAVERVEATGYSPAPLERISDALRWRGESELEDELERLVEAGALTRHREPGCDPRLQRACVGRHTRVGACGCVRVSKSVAKPHEMRMRADYCVTLLRKNDDKGSISDRRSRSGKRQDNAQGWASL
ncbi:MAG TPA: hypothetical protein VNV44_11685 [Solirubrobacteraceae bacterium]|nr:hypothetical protein [Solirubrobacteraceae bacterium]